MAKGKKKKRGGPPQTWKTVESEIAEDFGTKRNPLSGRNNIADNGTRRLGDVVGLENLLVEIKYRQSIASIIRSLETSSLAEEYHIPHWVHIERMKGNKDKYLLVVNRELFKALCQFIRLYSERDNEKKDKD
mgnify:CR=1 FL=1